MKNHEPTISTSLTSPGVVTGMSYPFPSLPAASGRVLDLGDAEDHELRRLHRRDPDLDDHLALVDRVRRVRFGITLDVERLLGGGTEQRAVTPEAPQECTDRALEALPQGHVVRFEDRVLRAVHDRRFDHVEQSADVDV